MIDLRSDTLTKPNDQMRRVMMDAAVGDDVFSEDPTINKLQDMMAERTGKEAALFVSSGTQANQVALKTHTRPGDEVILDYNSHIFNYESGAPGLISGVVLHPVDGKYGQPSVGQISACIREHESHLARTSLVCLENTHNRAGGTIFPIKHIEQIAQLARDNGLKMHLDGARLWNASVATGISLADYAHHFDSVSLCFSKGLGAPVGSVIVGDKDFIELARYYRKAMGGGMRQAGILAAGAIYAVEHQLKDLEKDHRHARMLAETLNACDGFTVELEQVRTNIVIVEVGARGMNASQMVEALADKGVLVFAFGPTRVRFVTHRDVPEKQIAETIQILNQLYR